MPRWLLPWLVPVGLLAVVVVIATSALVGAVLAVVAGLVCLPFVYRAYQDNRAQRPRPEPPGRPECPGRPERPERPERPNWLR